MAFAKFMASPVGRGGRMVLGVVLMIWGFSRGTTLGTVVGILGIVPFVAGAMNWCLLAKLLGAPFKGSDALKA
ncbi:MAG TPA: DUF2892 domain-containing protein [Thermoanaerobaculia bacterium]|nr:DUF2892 domain-containing protein [Thermoanaerobaculia bacterium]